MKKRLLLIPAALILAVLIVLLLTGKASAPFGANENKKVENPIKQQPSFDKKAHSLTDPKSIWVVASKARPLSPLTYAPGDLTAVGGGQFMRREAASALAKLVAGAQQDGLAITPLSGYRSYDSQVSVYNAEVAGKGQAAADRESARPGHSEHQTGWAIDVGGGGCGIDDCFSKTSEGKWIAANAYKYGYIVRYISGKESITGYRPEPWHIRYIGKDLAQEMHRTDTKTLEEFFDIVEKQTY